MDQMEFPDSSFNDTYVETNSYGDDELLISVFRDGDFYTAGLDRPTVEVLRDWLTIWLEEER